MGGGGGGDGVLVYLVLRYNLIGRRFLSGFGDLINPYLAGEFALPVLVTLKNGLKASSVQTSLDAKF